jgi:transcriptional regulator with XRE-family HTH domain
MTAYEFKQARKCRNLTQQAVAKLLGVSQTYVALLEKGKRSFPNALARKAVLRLQMNPLALPVKEHKRPFSAQHFAKQLAALGYPGFASMRSAWKRNPLQVLLDALAQDNLEARLTEALPWLLTNYANMRNANRDWLLEQARVRNLTNRLGFLVTLAKQVLARKGETASERYNNLTLLEMNLKDSRLDREDTLCQTLSPTEKHWLREARPEEAQFWHLLTDWRPEHLRYAA